MITKEGQVKSGTFTETEGSALSIGNDNITSNEFIEL